MEQVYSRPLALSHYPPYQLLVQEQRRHAVWRLAERLPGRMQMSDESTYISPQAVWRAEHALSLAVYHPARHHLRGTGAKRREQRRRLAFIKQSSKHGQCHRG